MSNNWWASKLGQPQTTRQEMPLPPSQVPMAYAPPATAPSFQQQQGARPTASAQASRCPSCGGGNYGSIEGTKPRCYECGYPLVQSGSGMGKGITGGPTPAGPTQAAVQVATGGWNPTTIIGKLG
jgi:hypothetical protein